MSAQSLPHAESLYQATRDLKDRIDILNLRSTDSATKLLPAYQASRRRLVAALAIDSLTLPDSVDRRALATMRAVLDGELTEHPEAPGGTTVAAGDSCRYDPADLAQRAGVSALADRMYSCFGEAADDVRVDGQRYDRLAILGLLAREPDAARRRRLFLALGPVWASMAGGAQPPYRELVRRRALAWAAGSLPYQQTSIASGLPPDTVVAWLTGVLDEWRRATPDSVVEPWDLYYVNGVVNRRLSTRISFAGLLSINDRYYRELGAPPSALAVHYDLSPRAGKGPVSFTTFGRRTRLSHGRWQPGAAWVFTSYSAGGFDNLAELLHESGHGVHIMGIRTRPAFDDWPDSDTFTEAIADMAGLEIFEPRWQWRYLGDSTGTAGNIRSKYVNIVMDMAWALLEVRLEQDPSLDPTAVWTDITSRYLHVAPHPELPWWAMRGQLIETTGYMLNYGLGAILVADLRQAVRLRHGDFATGDSTWYRYVRDSIYRFGLERSSRQVTEEFLGRPPSATALLDDLARGGQ
ncbi:MAG: hypothetical protein ACHQ2E_00910 [Gemmatimonadales bacterium]